MEEITRYDHISDVREKRKHILYDIRKGVILASDYPVIFKKFSELIEKENDRFLIKIPDNSYQKGLSVKLFKFLATGQCGDALTSKSMEEFRKIAKKIAEEINRHIRLEYDHPMRRFTALSKNGTVDDVVSYNLKKYHYDLFDYTWISMNLKPLILENISQMRSEERAELKGDF